MMKNELKEIQQLKKMAENEIVQWLSVLSQLENLERYVGTDEQIKKAFKAKK